ncbi:MAG: acetyl-CoA carboxylase biotin carboxyl carrier protein [Bacteroidetes bacterium]|nr:acetyl-CoA carboxylase biotin carboxyl carrier protein [Bacteroidota bacterium]
MKLNEIQDLIKFVAKSGVSEVALETKEIKIRITANAKGAKSDGQVMVQQQMPVVHSNPVTQNVMQPVTTNVAETKTAESKKENGVADESKLITIKSPMIGTFYRSSAPDKPAFVNVGDEVKNGKVVCIIEAMKLFNEIECEYSGRIVKILVDDASPVEYDQPLFLVEPN